MLQINNLRNQVSDYLLDQIRKDALKPDATISLAELSRTLQVSVTPIREALNQLSRSGFIEAVPNRGFILKPLQLREAMEIYPIISSMEGIAVSNSVYSDKDIEQLRMSNERFKNAGSIKKAVLADNDFHDLLMRPYQNETLNRLIADLKVRVLIYEFNFQDDKARFSKSYTEHARIIDLVEKKKTTQAVEMLSKHWEQSMHLISTKFSTK